MTANTFPTYTRFDTQFNQGVLSLAFNRPDAANAIDPTLVTELIDIGLRASHDESIKVVVLTGSGRFFSAGGDVMLMAGLAAQGGPQHAAREVQRLADDLHRALSLLHRMGAPLIMAVNGIAAGAGFSLAAMGDIVIAAQSAQFVLSYTGIGLSPDGGASYFLPRIIGLRKTQELMLTNRKLSSQEALDWGIVTEVVADDQLTPRAQALAKQLAQGSRTSHAAVKTLLAQTHTNPLETQLALESHHIATCAQSANGQEGLNAFVEKRRAVFG